MQSPSIHRNTGSIIQPTVTPDARAATDLQQRAEQPRQRSSHSLSSVGKRALKSVGKLFQKSKAPQQKAATPPTAKNVKTSPSLSNTDTARNKARESSASSSSPQNANSVPKSILRTRPNQASSSGAQTHEIEEVSSHPEAASRKNLRVRFDLPQDRLERSPSYLDSDNPMSDEEAVANATRQSRSPDSRLQGSDGMRRSMLATDPDQPSSSGSKIGDSDGPIPPREPMLGRSNGGRFELKDEKLVRNPEPQGTIQLDAKGKPDFSTFNTPGLAPLLDSILANPKQTYLAHESKHGVHGHQLLQANGHLLHLAQDDSSLAVIRSSNEALLIEGKKPPAVKMEREDGNIHIDTASGRKTQELPGKAHIAHITNVLLSHDGERMRVHEDRLYQFDPINTRWKIPEGLEDTGFSSLATGGNGSVYAKSDNAVVDLSSPFMPHVEVEDLQSFSVAPDNRAALLSGKKTQAILLTDMSPVIGGLTPKKTKGLELDGGKAQAAAVGLSGDKLFIADTQGRLYSADRSAFEGDEPKLKLMPEQANFQLAGVPLGGHNRVTGFINGDDGGVHALIKNRQGETHSHALDEQSSKLQSGWNLTNALVLNNNRGLTMPPPPTAADRLNLDRAGLVGLSEGRIQRWDATPECWKDAGIKDIDRLQRGADSNAYVLKGGKLHALKVAAEHPNMAFDHNTALAQTARSTKVEMGKEIEGLDDRVITAFAMVSNKRFVALDDKNKLTAHSKDHKPVTLDIPGLEGDIKSLSLDEKHNLHALTSTGGLYSLPKQAWQSVKLGDQMRAKWTPVALPGEQPVKALFTNDDNVLSAQIEDAEGQSLMQLKAGKWQAFEQRPVEENGLNDVHSRITGSNKTWRIPKTGLTLRMDVNTFGRSGMEKSNKVSSSDFIRANIYKNTAEMPRWMQNAGDHIQHRYQGRLGLREVYETESMLFTQLELIHESRGRPPARGQDLKARITALESKLGPQGATLVKELEALRDELENHSYTALVSIGQSYGKVKNLKRQDGILNQHGELAKPSARLQFGKKLADLGTKLNFKSSGHDLVKELQDALTQIAPSAENPTQKLLGTLKYQGLKLSHQKVEVPLGRRRDASEDHGLSKARLALDLVTLKNLGALLDQIEELPPQSAIAPLEKKLATLRDVTYGENPVKVVTDMGFTDNKALESGYEAVKSFLKSFKKPDHAVSVNMRAATGSKDQAELAGKFKSMLKQLEHGDDEIGLQRSYGMNLTTPFIILADKATGLWPTAGATANRNYILNAERCEGGVTLYLINEAAGNVSGGFGAGKDYWPGFFDANNPARSVDVGNNRTLTPNFRLGVDVTATVAASQRAGVVFNVPDEDIDAFVDDLFEGQLNPLQVLKKAVDHESYEARRFNFDLTAGGTADIRAGINLTPDRDPNADPNSDSFSAVVRGGFAANITVNLMTYTDYSLTQKNDKTELKEGGKNRPRFLNNVTAGGQLRAQIGGSHTAPTGTPASAPGPTPASQSAANNLGGALNFSVENRTVKRVKFRYNVAKPITTEGLSKLSKGLGEAFLDNTTKAKLAELADPLNARYTGKKPDEVIQAQLDGLEALFADVPPPKDNDKQYKALRDLKRAAVEHRASANKHSVMDNARFETSKTNLSGLTSESILTKIMSSVRDASAPGNAARVAEFMRQDPKLRAMLKEMEGSIGTLARVRLEPKDSLVDKIDEGSLNGTMTQSDLSSLLEDRNEMRIKRLVVFHTATQAENFTSPTPLVSYNSGANMSVTKTLGRINFVYGADQDKPIGYTFDGELSRPSASLKEAAGDLKKEGFELKS
ncbi:AvrE family type 3 secretion system effector [Pseudomonas syringae pv. actinidifoliorum]|uniref:type III secretion system effector AvrE1 n=1 Tax=Pseudomonas syringae TaxID=317 RepID=UPI0013733E99|nr:AvrE family type 3 secretion system effector [Pseudomonas syringae pv. actinidifoliorum]NAT65959.1 AvrE family type 3 secretion system effector [Pseudomonas syringae pv. actinidifoliorum]